MRLWIAVLVFGLVAGPGFGQSIELPLKFDQPATLELSGGRTLQITWLELNDSRCAEGVICVWEGQATVLIRVAEDDQNLGEFELILRADDEGEVAVGEYAIRLVEVAPYPKEGVQTERTDYVATLVITSRELATAVETSPWGFIKRMLRRFPAG